MCLLPLLVCMLALELVTDEFNNCYSLIIWPCHQKSATNINWSKFVKILMTVDSSLHSTHYLSCCYYLLLTYCLQPECCRLVPVQLGALAGSGQLLQKVWITKYHISRISGLSCIISNPKLGIGCDNVVSILANDNAAWTCTSWLQAAVVILWH